MRNLLLGIDIGGTFTDVVLLDPRQGHSWSAKVPSTPADPSIGFFNGLAKAIEMADADYADLGYLFHGSTVATNAILEGKGARTGLITTAGCRHVLEIGRHDIPRTANTYAWVKPERPVTPDLVAEAPERMDKDGRPLRVLDEVAVHKALTRLVDQGVAAIAVCLLHSYANPAHEQRIAAIAREVCPDVAVSTSSAILPVFREYERTMATVLNAYLMPKVTHYMEHLQEGAEARGIKGRFLMMKSDGGVFSPRDAAREPIHIVTSGPAAGVVGAIFTGRSAGELDLISLDMGGTSTDVCLIEGGMPELTIEGTVGPFPVPVPMLDIHTIGAGGGSIALVTGAGSLVVGPQSAGAAPGPACYGLGGELPTVTDANLVLGRLPESLLGGEMGLDRQAARTAIERHVAGPLGLTVEAAAHGILEIANNHMVGAIRVATVERGHDPKQFSLVSFGGAGGLHAGRLAELAGISKVLIPPRAGVLCALGLLASDLKASYARTCVQKPPAYDYAEIGRVYGELMERAHLWLEQQGIAPTAREVRWAADLRYKGQGYEIEVECSASDDIPAVVSALIEGFHVRHEQLYRYQAQDTPVEIVNLRIRVAARLLTLEPPPLDSETTDVEEALIGRRPVYFADAGWVECNCYDRFRLPTHQVVTGPAIIEQHDSTTVLNPGHAARQDAYGNLVMTIS